MPRYKLTLAYDGTLFSGWQKQEPFVDAGAGGHGPLDEALPIRVGEDRPRVALRTVQHVLEQAVRQIVRAPVTVLGASRTDAGVHAKGQVAAFSCEPWDEEFVSRESGVDEKEKKAHSPELALGARAGTAGSGATDGAVERGGVERGAGWPLSRGADRLLRALNGKLPDDVRVVAADVVSHQFDPIGDCTSKAYTYTMHEGLDRPLWDRWFVHPVWGELNERAMHEAAQRLVGEFDFAAFAAVNHGRLTTVRTVFSCDVRRVSDRRVQIEISGSGFLYNMVRIVAGTLVEVGKGKWAGDDIARILESKDRRNAGPTLPPTGLCLEWIKYDGASTTGERAGESE